MERASQMIKGIAVGAVSLVGLATVAITKRIIEDTAEKTTAAGLLPISKRIERLEQDLNPSAEDLEQLAQLREIRAEMEQALRDLASQRPWNADPLEAGEQS